MQAEAQAHAEPLPQDYLAWPEDFSEKKDLLFVLKRNSRAILLGVAGLSAILILAYCVTRSSSATIAPPTSAAVEKTSLPIARSSNEMEALRAAISEQNATNQQIAAALDALRAEQQELRKQIAATQARQTAGITGSITPRPLAKPVPPKKVDQGDARPVPYPPEARQVPYPRPN
jgi:ribosomal protein L29